MGSVSPAKHSIKGCDMFASSCLSDFENPISRHYAKSASSITRYRHGSSTVVRSRGDALCTNCRCKACILRLASMGNAYQFLLCQLRVYLLAEEVERPRLACQAHRCRWRCVRHEVLKRLSKGNVRVSSEETSTSVVDAYIAPALKPTYIPLFVGP